MATQTTRRIPVDARIRNVLRMQIAHFGLDAVSAVLDTFRDPNRPESAAAIRGHLLADLATWPAAFGRALAPEIRERTADLEGARFELDAFERGREPSGVPSGCGCGCHGRSCELGRYLTAIRREATGVRQSAHLRPAARVRCRARLAESKADLLAWMWRTDQRRIDRLQLAQHAVEDAKHETERHEAQIQRCDRMLDLLAERRAIGVYRKGPRRGQPIPEPDRVLDAGTAKLTREEIEQHRARILRLCHLIAEDVPQLARDFTGCGRGVA